MQKKHLFHDLSKYSDADILYFHESLFEALDVFRLGLILRKDNPVLYTFHETFKDSLKSLKFEIKKRGI